MGGRRDYVTKLPAWHGRQIEPQMCVKSGSLETLQGRREERGGGSSRSVALTPPCLIPAVRARGGCSRSAVLHQMMAAIKVVERWNKYRNDLIDISIRTPP